MMRRLVRAGLTFVLLLIVAGMATFLYLAWQINHTGSQDQAQRADVIVILGARVEADGQPGPDLRSRTLHAVALFQQGLAPVIICTGGYHNDPLSAASVCRRLALSQGVPSVSLLLADGSMTTSEDATNASLLMTAQGWQTAIVVSHPLHLERACLLFEDQEITVYPSPTSTDLGLIPWKTRAWLTAREAIGIIWVGLEKLGVPYEWTEQLSQWVYGPQATPATN